MIARCDQETVFAALLGYLRHYYDFFNQYSRGPLVRGSHHILRSASTDRLVVPSFKLLYTIGIVTFTVAAAQVCMT